MAAMRRPNGSPKNITASVRTPEDLWMAARAKALQERRSFSEVVRELLQGYVEGKK